MSEKDYSSEFNETSFWRKIATTSGSLGAEFVEKVLVLYFAMVDEDTPLWAKALLLGALGYFICPIDAIPDLIPFAGYTDDAGAIAAALASVALHIKPEHRAKAKSKVKEWFE